MGKALTYIGGALLALLSLLLIVPAVVDWNSYRGAFEEEASRVLGREVRVGGKANLRLLPTPYVRFEKVRIADTAGTLGTPFFRAESFTMGLAMAPLLRGALEATHIELRQPVLTLALDADGRGNWRDVALTPGAASILPAEVKLNAVDIVDGEITVKGANGDLAQITAISGELSADGLKGPYKFRGSAAWRGEVREVRVNTSEPEANGDLRFKGFVRAPKTGGGYTLDARLSDVGGKPRLEGELLARLPLAASAAAPAGTRKPEADRDILDLRAGLKGDLLGVAFQDIAIAFDQGGQPQLVSGDGEARWQDGLRLRLALSSRWLDLDRLSGRAAGSGGVETVRDVVPVLVDLLPETGQVDVRASVDQINLGGDLAGNVRLHLERFRGPMLVRELQASLPGGSRLDLNGRLDVGANSSFAGDVALRGTSLARLMGWAARGHTIVDLKGDGPYAVNGQLSLDRNGFTLAGLAAELPGATPLTGSAGYRWADRRRLDLTLEGQEIDVSAVMPGLLDPERARRLLWPRGASSPPAPAGGLSIDARSTDAQIHLRAGILSDGERSVRDVDARLALEDGRLRIGGLRLLAADGLKLDLDGDIADIAGTPKGKLGGHVTATTAAALDALLAAAGLGKGGATEQDRAARPETLIPARLAGSIRIAERGATSTDIAFDGLLGKSRAAARIAIEGSPQGWRDGPVEVRGSVEGEATSVSLLELFGGAASAGRRREEELRNGRLSFKAAGVPRTGLVTAVSLRSEGQAIDFEGRVAEPAAGPREVNGTVRIDAAKAGTALALAGLEAVRALQEQPVSGQAEIDWRSGRLRVRPFDMAIGGSRIDGIVTLTRSPAAPATIDAVLTMARASLPALIAGLGEQTRGRPQPAPGAPGAPESVWPDLPFDLSLLGALQGRVKLSAGRLALEPGLELADAVLDLELAADQIRLANIEGRALGGELRGRMVLEKAPLAGAALAGALRIDDARIEALAGPEAATGRASVIMQFSGRALTPSAMMAVMQGKGEITLGAVQVNRMTPSAVPRAVTAVLERKVDPAGDGLRRALREGLSSGGFAIAPTKLELQIVDGAIRIQRLPFETEDARGSLVTTIELATLKLDSEWRLEPKVPARPIASADGRPATPPAVSVVHVGPLRSLAALEPRMSTDALERILTVWRMERDVEELERLRREDEERVRREQERQKAIEEERLQRLRGEGEAGGTAPQATGVPPPAPSPGTAPSLPGPARFEVPASGQAVPPTAPSRNIRVAPPPAGASQPAPPTPKAVSEAGDAAKAAEAAVAVPKGEGGDAQAPLDFPKRPSRVGQPKPATPKSQPFNPFGPQGLGTN